MFLYRQTDLIMNKEIRNSLVSLYGVGYYKSLLICAKIGFSYPYNINLLNIYNFNILIFVLDGLTWLENRIKREIDLKIKRLIEIQTLKGTRHKDNLPVYGQRTRTMLEHKSVNVLKLNKINVRIKETFHFCKKI